MMMVMMIMTIITTMVISIAIIIVIFSFITFLGVLFLFVYSSGFRNHSALLGAGEPATPRFC